MQKTGDAGDSVPRQFFGFSAKFRDFIRIFLKAITATSLVFRMYDYVVFLLPKRRSNAMMIAAKKNANESKSKKRPQMYAYYV